MVVSDSLERMIGTQPQELEMEEPRSPQAISEHESASETVEVDQLPYKPQPLQKRLGYYTITIAVLGFLGPLSALAFLIFLWKADASSQLWLKIIAAGWATRSVTLASLVIRLAIAGQATICTSMLAGLVLERNGIRYSQAAAVSILRFVNAGPYNLIAPILQSFSAFTFLSITPVLLLILLMTSTISQFSSTALLSDLQPIMIPGNADNSSIAYGIARLNPTYLTPGTRFFSIQAPYFPTFAEYTEAPMVSEGVVDTGMTIRALFPIVSQPSRYVLRDYKGNATIFDSRVVCVRPEVSNISLTFVAGSLNLLGTVRPAITTPIYQIVPQNSKRDLGSLGGLGFELPPGPPPPTQDFAVLNCSIARLTTVDLIDDSLSTLCHLYFPSATFISPITGPSNWTGQAFLMTNSTNWNNLTPVDGVNFSSLPYTYQDNGEWLDVDLGFGAPGGSVQVSMTLCYMSYVTAYSEIHAYSDSNRTEPSLVYNVSGATFTSEAVRQQLGATNETLNPEERGILSITPKVWKDPTNGTLDFAWANLDAWRWPQGISDLSTPYTFTLCIFCAAGGEILHQSHVQMVQDVLRDTHNPAIAIQVLFTTLLQMAYYSQSSQFGLPGPVQIQNFVVTQAPVGMRGLTIVIAILVVHLICVLGIIIRFMMGSRFSMVGEAWHVVAQLASDETDILLMESSLKTDKQVKNGMKMRHGNTRVGLQRNEDSGRVEVRDLA
jgi:hypothetical protein